MPISQDRFITVLHASKRIIEMNRTIREIVLGDYIGDLSIVNSVLTHTNDKNAKTAINLLLNRLQRIVNTFALQPVDEQLVAIVLAEDLHFQKVKDRNEKSAKQRRYVRQYNGIEPRERPEAKLEAPNLTRTAPQINEPDPDITNSPEFLRLKQQMIEEWNSEQDPKLLQHMRTKGGVIPERSESGQRAKPTKVNNRVCFLCKEEFPSDLIYCSHCNAQYQPPQSSIPSEPISSVAEIKQTHTDGVVRYLPSDEELNALPSAARGGVI